jgi:hypothetical protein
VLSALYSNINVLVRDFVAGELSADAVSEVMYTSNYGEYWRLIDAFQHKAGRVCTYV